MPRECQGLYGSMWQSIVRLTDILSRFCGLVVQAHRPDTHKPGPKSRFPESVPPSLTDISRKTPFIFKGDPGRPRVSIPAKITPISLHQHIKTTTLGYCLICRNFEGIQKAQI